MLSDKDVAFLCADKELTNEEISELFDGCPDGVEADIFTYDGRTLILAHAAEPQQVLCANARQKKKPHTIKCEAKSYGFRPLLPEKRRPF